MKKLILCGLWLCVAALAYCQENVTPLEYAIRAVKVAYGHDVSVVAKGKPLFKFGLNPDLSTTRETVWYQGGSEYFGYGNCNCIDSLSSSSTADNQNIVIEGLTIDGNEVVEFITQTADLNGRNVVQLTTPLWRITRLYNNNSTDFAGDIYVYSGGSVTDGVPQVADSIHIRAAGSLGYNQSLKGATTLSSVDYWFITSMIISVNTSLNQDRKVDFALEIREFGKVFRRIVPASATNVGGTVELFFDPYIIVQPRSDIRVTAISSGTSTAVRTFFNGYLARIK